MRVDSIGRIRQISGDAPRDHWLLPPGSVTRFRHPAYILGYRKAVSYEYELLMVDLFSLYGEPDEDSRACAAAISYPSAGPEYHTYGGYVEYYQAIEAAIVDRRPELIRRLAPLAARHGLDALPWGMGWLVRYTTGYAPQEPRGGLEAIHPPAILP